MGERERERAVDREVRKSSPWIYPTCVFFYGFFTGQTFTQGLKITGEKHAGNLGVGESIAQKSLHLGALCIKCKPWGQCLKNIAKLAGGLLL